MVKQSTAPVQSQDWAINTAILGLQANLDVNIKVKLFTSGPGTIDQFTVPADFTEATFAGYAAVSIVSATMAVAVSPNANAVVLFGSATWVSGAVVGVGESVKGYYITDSAGTLLYESEYFDAPVDVVALGQIIDLLLQIPFLMKGSLA